MAFGDDENAMVVGPLLSPDSIKNLLDQDTTSPLDSTALRIGHSRDILLDEGQVENCVEDGENDGDLEEPEQTFPDHDEICRRLERTLALNYLGSEGKNFDDWSELASVIGYHYAAQMDSSWVKSAGKQNISPSALLLCLIYMERLHMTHPDFRYQNLMTSSELFVVSLMSACKFLYDVGEVGDCYNGTWSRHCRIPIKRLNRIEVEFLDALKWNLQSDVDEFDDMMARVQTDIVRSNLRFHTSLTYSDLLVLANLSNGFSQQMILDSIASLFKIFAALTASYLLFGVLTLSIGAPLAFRLSASSQVTPSATPVSPLHHQSNAHDSCSSVPSSTRILCNQSTQSLAEAVAASRGRGSYLPRGPPHNPQVGRWRFPTRLGHQFSCGLPLTNHGLHPRAELHYIAF